MLLFEDEKAAVTYKVRLVDSQSPGVALALDFVVWNRSESAVLKDFTIACSDEGASVLEVVAAPTDDGAENAAATSEDASNTIVQVPVIKPLKSKAASSRVILTVAEPSASPTVAVTIKYDIKAKKGKEENSIRGRNTALVCTCSRVQFV